MNVVLLTALALGGASGTAIKAIDLASAPPDGYASDCDACGGHHGHGGLLGRGHFGGHHLHGHCWGPMPQTCYDPPYGCYPGTRHMNRYPAFHAAYYRRPYNYRNVFDYPWHADLHEPTSFYSYNVSGETGGARPGAPQPVAQPPRPIPTPVAALPLHQRLEQATARPVERSQRGTQTLRR